MYLDTRLAVTAFLLFLRRSVVRGRVDARQLRARTMLSSDTIGAGRQRFTAFSFLAKIRRGPTATPPSFTSR